jgi:hypothetical protein
MAILREVGGSIILVTASTIYTWRGIHYSWRRV